MSSATSTTSNKPMKNGRGFLKFKVQGAISWTPLEDSIDRVGYNVSDLVFAWRIMFTQRSRDNTAVCAVTYSQTQYQGAKFENQKGQILVSFIVKQAPDIKFSGDKANEAINLPLAKLCSSFVQVQILLDWADFKPKPTTIHACRRQLVHLTSGNITNDPATDEGMFVTQTMAVSLAESTAQEKLVGTEKGSIRTSRWKNRVLVQFWPKSDLDRGNDLDTGSQKYGTSYIINSTTAFPADEAKAHKMRGAEGNIWQMAIVDHIPGLDAPIVGLLQNSFKDEKDLEEYVDRMDDNVQLEPVFNDLLGGHSRSALNTFADHMDSFAAEASGFSSANVKQKTMPMKGMFLTGMPYVDQENRPLRARLPVPQNRQARLNASQLEAVNKAFRHKVSLVWGPAATGKSETLSRLSDEILLDPKERVLVTAPRHVAVDSIMDRCTSIWYERHGRGSFLPFVRLYSHSQIVAHWASDHPALRNPAHIDNVRVALAKRAGGYNGFRQGREQLKFSGEFVSEDSARDFSKDCAALDASIRVKARVVFCTTAASRNHLLRWETAKPASALESKPDYQTWEPTTNIVDEAACANPLEILLPLVTFDSIERLVLGGDHQQLPPFLISQEAIDTWDKTLFEQLIRKGYPCTMLNVQYRTHDDLAEANGHIVYGDRLEAYHKTSNPRPALQKLFEYLPLHVRDGSRQYDLTSYLNFINVAHGHEQGPDKGSKCNLEEISTIEAVVRGFLDAGFQPKQIAVETGYLLQFDRFQKHFANLERQEPTRGWSRVKLVTFNTVQGAEYDIVIFSLVKTMGTRGFVNEKRRANVATSRAREAQYYVGSWPFWTSQQHSGNKTLDQILYRCRDTCGSKSKTGDRPAFLVNEGRSAPTPATAVPRLPSIVHPHLTRQSIKKQEAPEGSATQAEIAEVKALRARKEADYAKAKADVLTWVKAEHERIKREAAAKIAAIELQDEEDKAEVEAKLRSMNHGQF
ncbi:MAG: hypothetical protein Q9164_005508 [Protoblastenia rupestris]